ncbi:hypothetical protein A9K97_gp035 [Tokyovirus A1]|uniref:hypothetical protein n=1 Tax=Tokyovirus A1 TaxID=1826170 RepID=UPI0007A973D4|nr:hypothetical protein A9K97_gp035 [Tokyovirus A1]BAU80316.1 conserved hypothetical protein [Tokyovirus A1]
MSGAFQTNYERELAIANLIPTRVILSQTTEDTREDPRRCAPRFMPGSGTNFPYNIYEKDWVRERPYFARDIADRGNWNFDFLVTRYISEKDGNTYELKHGPDPNVSSRFGWNTWNNRIGEKSAGVVTGSYGCPPDCGKKFENRWTPHWYIPNCAP